MVELGELALGPLLGVLGMPWAATVPAANVAIAARAIAAFRAKVDTVGGNAGGGGGGPRRPPANFYGMNAALALELTAKGTKYYKDDALN